MAFDPKKRRYLLIDEASNTYSECAPPHDPQDHPVAVSASASLVGRTDEDLTAAGRPRTLLLKELIKTGAAMKHPLFFLDQPAGCFVLFEGVRGSAAVEYCSKNFHTKLLAKLMLGQEFCDNFYKRIDDSFCVNLVHGNTPDWYGGQWCYVSSRCPSAGSANGTTPLRVKLCTPGQDRLLRDKSPQELRRWAMEQDFDVGLLVKMAYPVDKQSKWPVVQKAFNGTLAPGEGMGLLAADAATASIAQKLQGLLDARKPVVLDSNDGLPPFAVVDRSTSYEITLDLPHADMKHPSSITQWRCVQGCKD